MYRMLVVLARARAEEADATVNPAPARRPATDARLAPARPFPDNALAVREISRIKISAALETSRLLLADVYIRVQ